VITNFPERRKVLVGWARRQRRGGRPGGEAVSDRPGMFRRWWRLALFLLLAFAVGAGATLLAWRLVRALMG
jgi:hypothetical protein